MAIDRSLGGVVAGSGVVPSFLSKTVSVVICTSEMSHFDRLVQAVHSVFRQDHPAHELLLVVDDNEDLSRVAKAAFPKARIISNCRGKGIAGSRNTGLLAATGDIVAFLDDDIVADPNWLWQMTARFSSQYVVGVGGQVVPYWPAERPVWMPTSFAWVVGCSVEGRAEDSLVGGNIAFRRSAIVMAGLFDEVGGKTGNDRLAIMDVCLRTIAMFPGSRIALDGDARVLRQIGDDQTTFRHFWRVCFANGWSMAQISGQQDLRNAVRIVAPISETFDPPGRGSLARALMATTGELLDGFARLWRRTFVVPPQRPEWDFAPLKVMELDLGKRLPRISAKCEEGLFGYGSVRIVVRAGGRLRAVLQVPLFGEDLSAVELDAIVDPFRGRSRTTRKVTPGRVRIVVATRDRTASLARCLDSLLAQDHPDFEIVVVDNAPSSDDTRRMVRRKYLRTRKVRYLLEERAGLANAHNRGLEGLNADFVAFTDDDVVVDRAWLRMLVKPFSEGPEVGCVTGSILPAELETRAQYWTEMHGGFLKGVLRRDFDLAENRPATPLFPYASGMFGSGANMAFRSSTLTEIGGFDPALGAGTFAHGGDDLAAFADTVLAGHRLVYTPDALVWHYHRRGVDGMERQAFGYGVGLGAHLTRLVLKSPKLAFHFLFAMPAAVRKIFSRKSAKNARLPSDYPSGFVWRERLGILAGVPAYLKSRRANRRGMTAKPAWKSI